MEDRRATDFSSSKTPNAIDKLVAAAKENDISTEMADHDAESRKIDTAKSSTQGPEANDTVPSFSEKELPRSIKSSSSEASDEKVTLRTDETLVSPLACLEEAEADEDENDRRVVASSLDRTLSDSESVALFSLVEADSRGLTHTRLASSKAEPTNAPVKKKSRASHKVNRQKGLFFLRRYFLCIFRTA